MASKVTEIVNFGSSINKYCDIRSYPSEAIVVHEPDDTYATDQPNSKARPSVRGVACPPQWLPVLLAAAPNTCIGWFGSIDCTALPPPASKSCNAEIYNDEVGHCHCTDQNVSFSCGIPIIGDPRPPFTCTLACNNFSQPDQEPCTGSRTDCGRHFCNPDGKYEAYYKIQARPGQGSESGTVTKVEVIFNNTSYNNENPYNKDLLNYTLISTGCTYGNGTYEGSVKYDKTTNKPINPPNCTTKTDKEFNSDGEPIKKQDLPVGRFNDTYYGVGNGSLFVPVSSDFRAKVSNIFEFHWCPDQNTFQVMVFKTGPYQFVHLKPEDICSAQYETTVAEMQAKIDQLQADKTGTIKMVFV